MQIVLKDHDHRYGVEQTVMALLPREKIQTQEDYDPSLPYLLSYFNQDKTTAHCHVYLNQQHYEGESTQMGQRSHQQEQFMVKDAVYSAIVQSLDSPPPWGSLTGVRPVKMASKLLRQGKNVVDVLAETYHVDGVRSQLALDCAKVSLEIQEKMADSLSLYVGIPFCPSRCHYCSFFSTDIQGNEPLLSVYLDHLITEIQTLAPRLRQKKITSLYVGGGTPTVLCHSDLDRLLTVLDQEINRADLLEFTVEAGRPDTITPEKIQVLQKHQVGRISINPQTMKEETLAKMGRGHSIAQIRQAYALAQGKFIINMDMIAGLVEETPEDFFRSLEEIIALRPPQITVHSLTPKKNTPLQGQRSQEQPVLWDKALDQAWDRLRQAGYQPYYLYRQKQITQGLENVGWALPDSQGQAQPSYYNVAMMEEFQSILGFGSGAMTKLVLPEDISRQQNPKYPKEYGDKLESTMERKLKILQSV